MKYYLYEWSLNEEDEGLLYNLIPVDVSQQQVEEYRLNIRHLDISSNTPELVEELQLKHKFDFDKYAYQLGRILAP